MVASYANMSATNPYPVNATIGFITASPNKSEVLEIPNPNRPDLFENINTGKTRTILTTSLN